MSKIKVGDPVVVIAGKNKGKVSSIDEVIKKNLRKKGSFVQETYFIVKGVNEVKKAVKGKGFVAKTLPIHSSNVMYYVDKQKKGSKLGYSIDKKLVKKRVVKSTKDVL